MRSSFDLSPAADGRTGRTPDGRTPDGRTPGGRTPGFTSAVNTEVASARRVAPELGVHILDLQSGETVYSFHSGTLRIVASNTKLVTTAAALDRLGPGFFFETEVRYRGAVEGATLEGDLAVVGGGDPNLSGRHYFGDPFGGFRRWAAALLEQGVHRIEGDVVLVPSLFDSQSVHPDWPRDQLTRWYEAPVAALSFNDNCVLVKVRPRTNNGGRSGGAVEVETVPRLPIFRVESTAATTWRSRDQRLRIDRREGSNVPTVGGRIHHRTESIDKWVAVADPVEYFGAALATAFAEEGITIGGRVRRAPRLPAEEGWRPLLTHRSDLLTTLEIINKRSQNFYAESLLKLLGAQLCGRGHWDSGVRVATEFLAQAGLAPGSYRLADGSGMSRNNRFTPEQLTHLLHYMYYHRWGSEFLRTLPHSGERDLRWAERLAEAPYRGNVLPRPGRSTGCRRSRATPRRAQAGSTPSRS